MKLGRIHWGVIGIVTLLIVVMAPSDNEGSGRNATRAENRSAADTANPDRKHMYQAGHVELYRLAKLELLRKNNNKVGDAFNTSVRDVPLPIRASRPAAPVPPPVVVPTAPSLPFTYLGRYGDSASRTVILSKDDRVYTVSVGDVIENTYRVEKFTAGMVNLTYLPLSIQQHLATGEAL